MSSRFYSDDYYSAYQNSYKEHAAKMLSHVDQQGKASMVDVGEKAATERVAKARAFVNVGNEVFNLIKANNVKKGDVLTVAKIAGMMGAKKTSELIPLCHPLNLSKVGLELRLDEYESGIEIV